MTRNALSVLFFKLANHFVRFSTLGFQNNLPRMHQHSLSEEVNTVRKARLRGWEGVLMFREGERKIGGKRERARDASTVDHALQNRQRNPTCLQDSGKF